jgi:hypothetical protein
VLLVDPAQNNAFRAINRAWREGATVRATAGPSGAPIRYGISGLTERGQEDLVRALALQAERTASAPGRELRAPRIGLYQPWSDSADEGWARWVLEQYGFSVAALHPEDFKVPLTVDVVIMAGDARVAVDDRSAQGGGDRETAAGTVRREYAYMLTAGDVQALEQFIRRGGTLVCLNRASAFAIEQFKLPVRNVVADLGPDEFFVRGSIVAVTTDPAHPVMAGMPAQAMVFVDGSPVFEPLPGFAGAVVARYDATGSPLRSGYLVGEQHLQGQAAALDVQLDAGHVVLLGFRPEWRGQPFGTFRVLFNAALYIR